MDLGDCLVLQAQTHTAWIWIQCMVIISNSLSQFCAAAFAYTIWTQDMILAPPCLLIGMVCFIGLGFKYALQVTHSAYPAKCCIGYVLSFGYSMPSIHAAVVMLLAIYFSRQYWLYDSHISSMRVSLIWCYAVAVCYSRVYLTLNNELDVLVGAVIGLVFGVLSKYITDALEPKLSFLKME